GSRMRAFASAAIAASPRCRTRPATTTVSTPPHERARVRAHRLRADAGPQPSVPDSRDPRGWRTGLAEPGLPRRLSRAFPVDRSVLYVSGIVSEFWNDRSLSGRA